MLNGVFRNFDIYKVLYISIIVGNTKICKWNLNKAFQQNLGAMSTK